MLLALVNAALAIEIVTQDPPGAFEKVKLDVGGFMQPRFNFIQPDDSVETLGELGFAMRRVRPEFKGELSAPDQGLGGAPLTLRWVLSVELMPQPKLQDAFVELSLAKPLGLRVGQQKAPTSRSFVVSDRATLFPDRAHEIDELPARDIGASLLGSVGDNHLEYQVGLFDGEGSNVAHNENQRLMGVWRVVTSPIGGPGTKTEFMGVDEAPTFSLGYHGLLNTVGPEGEQVANFAHGAEVFGHWRWVSAQGELNWEQWDYELQSEMDYTLLGGYAQAMLFVPAPKLEEHLALLGRVEQLDPYRPEQGDKVLEAEAPDEHQMERDLTAGVGLYAGKPYFKTLQSARLVVAYTHKQELDGLAYHNDELTVGAHINF